MAEEVETYISDFHDKNAVEKMEYNRFGNTPLKLSKLGLGGGAMSGFYDEFDDSEAISTVVDAIKAGINYIDTAPYYGQGRSETLLGKALKLIPRKAYYLSTKVGRYTPNWNDMFDYSQDGIIKKFELSLQRLGVDYVDLLIVHDIEFADMNIIFSEALPAVEKLVKMKKARYIGVSGYPISVLAKALSKSQIKLDFVLTYSRDTLIDHTLHKYLPLFEEMNLGIINAAPTALSLLTNIGPQPWHPAGEDLKKLCQQAIDYCKKNGVELGRLAVYHSLQTKGCHNVLVGMNTRSILNENLSLLLNGLTEKEEQILKHLKENVFLQDQCLHWQGIEIARYKAAITGQKHDINVEDLQL